MKSRLKVMLGLQPCCLVVQSGGKGKGDEFWLVWKFEGESTLADLMKARDFPYNVREGGVARVAYGAMYKILIP